MISISLGYSSQLATSSPIHSENQQRRVIIQHQLNQFVTKPTRGESIFDLVFVSDSLAHRTSRCIILSQVLTTLPSYLTFTFLTFDGDSSYDDVSNTTVSALISVILTGLHFSTGASRPMTTHVALLPRSATPLTIALSFIQPLAV